MAFNLRVVDRDQAFLLPPSLADWLPRDHLAWSVLGVVDEFDLTDFLSGLRADGRGGASFDPAMMVALLLYNYCVGVRSSRKVEKRCVEDVASRLIAAGSFPDHATIARFVAKNETGLASLFGQILHLCVKADMIDGTLLALDGTKMVANASNESNRKFGDLAAAFVREAIETDEDEDDRFGDRRGDEVPDKLRDKEWIRKTLEDIRVEQAERDELRPDREKPDLKVNIVDPDARVMRTRQGLMPAFNCQAVVTRDQVIVAASVGQQSADSHQLLPMARQTVDTLNSHEIPIGVLVADAGYWDAGDIAESPVNSLIAMQHLSVAQTSITAVEAEQAFRAVVGGNVSQAAAARGLGLKPHVFRKLLVKFREDPAVGLAVFVMRDKFDDPMNRQLMSKRKTMIEPVFGQMKENRGIRRFLRRGKQAVNVEWQLICASHNMLKYWKQTNPGYAGA